MRQAKEMYSLNFPVQHITLNYSVIDPIELETRGGLRNSLDGIAAPAGSGPCDQSSPNHAMFCP